MFKNNNKDDNMKNSNIENHYKQDELYQRITDAMSASGMNFDSLTREHFSLVDEFHVMGNLGTSVLAEAIKFNSGIKVLDLGCGIGGACRFIADKYDCEVTGIDITPEYIETAQLISDKVGIKNVTFEQASAMDLPFEKNTFDVIWTQHVQMNIEDKSSFINEAARVLKPSGKLAYFDILSKNGQGLYFPTPWAQDKSMNFLCSSAEWNELLSTAGLKVESKENITAEAIEWFKNFFETVKTHGAPVVGPNLLMGKDAPIKLQNLFKNLVEEKCEVEMGVYLTNKNR